MVFSSKNSGQKCVPRTLQQGKRCILKILPEKSVEQSIYKKKGETAKFLSSPPHQTSHCIDCSGDRNRDVFANPL
jgi:hypothetical protein